MAGSLSDYSENALLDHLFNNTPLTSPSDVYAALFTSAPSDSGGGTEVSGGGYARVSISFGSASSGAIDNDSIIDFGTASASWGTIVAMAVFDASTGGNMLGWADLATSKTVDDGDAAEFPVGELDITLD